MGKKRVKKAEAVAVADMLENAVSEIASRGYIEGLAGGSNDDTTDLGADLDNLQSEIELAEASLRAARKKLRAIGERVGVYPCLDKKRRRKKYGK